MTELRDNELQEKREMKQNASEFSARSPLPHIIGSKAPDRNPRDAKKQPSRDRGRRNTQREQTPRFIF